MESKTQKTAVHFEQSGDFLRKAYGGALISGVLSILSGCINIIVDGILVGQKVGVTGLAAINYCVPIYLLLCIAGSFFVSGAAICCSQEIGRNHMDEAARYYRIAVTMAAVSSIVFLAVGFFLTDPISVFLCRDESAITMVKQYNFVTLTVAAPKIMIYVPFWFLRLDGKNKASAIMMAIMAFGNVLLDLIFLYILNMGVFGAAIASVTATAMAAVYGFWMQERGNSSFKSGICFPARKELPLLASAGSPAAMNNIFQFFRLLSVNSLLAGFGGSILVAEFTIINGISSFSEAVTLGVPQAGSAIMGISSGERDNKSCRILLGVETRIGMLLSIGFGICIVGGSGLIGKAYGFSGQLRTAMICLGISMLPSLWNNILIQYYSVAGYSWLSNILILLRVFGVSVPVLWCLLRQDITPWWFLVLGELLTIAVWFIFSAFYSRSRGSVSRFFLMDETLEKEGRIISFSLKNDPEKICQASERITDFCRENGLKAKQIMYVSLAIEEILTLISTINEGRELSFDIRIYHVKEETGIRIRYDGMDYNPLAAKVTDEMDVMEYMGIHMIQKLVKQVIYQSTFGMNTLLVLL